jgi:hypothetical protein
MPADFPPGELGRRFNRIDALVEGEFVYVRMQVMHARPNSFGNYQLKLMMRPESAAFGTAWQAIMVPASQIVCREPRAMEADGGQVRGID